MDSVSIGLHWTGPNEASWPLPNEEKKWETDVHILFTDMVANLLEAMLDKVWSHGLPRLKGSQKYMYLIIVAFPPKSTHVFSKSVYFST